MLVSPHSAPNHPAGKSHRPYMSTRFFTAPNHVPPKLSTPHHAWSLTPLATASPSARPHRDCPERPRFHHRLPPSHELRIGSTLPLLRSRFIALLAPTLLRQLCRNGQERSVLYVSAPTSTTTTPRRPPATPCCENRGVYNRGRRNKRGRRTNWNCGQPGKKANDFTPPTAKSRTIAVRLISMAMTGYYKTFVRPRAHRPLSMIKYDPVGT